MFCPTCGEKIYNIMEICPYCGAELKRLEELKKRSTENIYKQFIPGTFSEKRVFSLDGKTIEFDNIFLEKNSYLAILRNLGSYNTSLVNKILRDSSELDELIESVVCTMITISENTAQILYSLVSELNLNGVEKQGFIEGFINQINLEPNLNKIQKITTQISQVIEFAAAKRQQQAKMKNSSRWVGGGFGIRGAIKGSIQAAVLNVGSDIIYGITNTASIAMLSHQDKKVIEKMKRDIFDDGEIQSIFRQFVKMVNTKSLDYLSDILTKKMENDTTGKSEDFFHIASKLHELERRIDFENIDNEERKAYTDLYVMLLQEAPYIEDVYLGLYKINQALESELLHMARYFGVCEAVSSGILEIEYKKIVMELAQTTNDCSYKEVARENIERLKKNLLFHTDCISNVKDKIILLEETINKV